jgi:hypothetical protein
MFKVVFSTFFIISEIMTHLTAAAINVLLLRQVSCSLKACNNNNNKLISVETQEIIVQQN